MKPGEFRMEPAQTGLTEEEYDSLPLHCSFCDFQIGFRDLATFDRDRAFCTDLCMERFHAVGCSQTQCDRDVMSFEKPCVLPDLAIEKAEIG